MPDGGTRTHTVEQGKAYSVEEVIELSKRLFVSSLAKILFQHSDIKLGYNNDEFIENFMINFKEVGLIDYYKLKSIPKPHLFLLSSSNPDGDELAAKLDDLIEKEDCEPVLPVQNSKVLTEKSLKTFQSHNSENSEMPGQNSQ